MESTNNPLARFSLAGLSSELEQQAVKSAPLLQTLANRGEATIWYASPNGGKTLLALSLTFAAIADRKIKAEDVYYLNVDDNSEGLALKGRLCDDLGIHMIAPNHQGFKAQDLTPALKEMARNGSAKNTFVIADTVKKFTDLMNKKAASEFGDVVRQFVGAGGTFLGLAHVNKHKSSGGKSVYQGTSDIVDDFDSAYLLETVEEDDHTRTVQFENKKRRGNSVDRAQFSFSVDPAITYEQRLASVQEVDDYKASPQIATDPIEDTVVQNIQMCITHGHATRMKIIQTASRAAKCSQRAVYAVLDRYTGDDPELHHWTYTTQARGAKVYTLLAPAAE